MGCDVIDRIINRGIEKGRQEGINIGDENLALLMKKLFAQKRIEDAQKASESKEYRMQLMKEFAIV